MYAVPVPMAMSVNILGLRFTTDAHPRWKKGHPPHSTTGVARINCSQPPRALEIICSSGCPGIISPIAKRSTGRASAVLTQKRRVMSTSSRFSASSKLTLRGSSAIPQRGQDPGSACTISGCMGQVYSVLVGGAPVTRGSSAMPHLGQGPGPGSRTSGSIGQM